MSAAMLSRDPLRTGRNGSRGLAPLLGPNLPAEAFTAHFIDVAASAGLRAPAICGAVDHTTYLIETTGAGIAFLDYDNDGWLDIFMLSGTLMEGTPRTPQTASTRTIAMEPSPMSPKELD